jgi:hypothetical protein
MSVAFFKKVDDKRTALVPYRWAEEDEEEDEEEVNNDDDVAVSCSSKEACLLLLFAFRRSNFKDGSQLSIAFVLVYTSEEAAASICPAETAAMISVTGEESFTILLFRFNFSDSFNSDEQPTAHT